MLKRFVKLETGRTGLACDGVRWRNYVNTVTNIYKHQRILISQIIIKVYCKCSCLANVIVHPVIIDTNNVIIMIIIIIIIIINIGHCTHTSESTNVKVQ